MRTTKISQLTAYWVLNKTFILFVLGLGIIVSILIKMNVHVWGRLSIRHLIALIGPYLISFTVFWLMIRLCWRQSSTIKIGILLVLVLWIGYSADFWYEYAYHWLPAKGINFVGKITPRRLIQFNNRVFVGNTLVIVIAFIVQFVTHYLSFRARFKRRSNALNTTIVSARLSDHFTRQWIKIVQDNKVLHRPETIHLLQYMIDIVANKKLKVAIAEEWMQLRVMASCFTDRTVLFEGEQLLASADWNRSIPAAALLSWFENALDHSPKGEKYIIWIIWCRKDTKLQLQMRNTVATARSHGHSGTGTQMVQQLFDQLLPGNYKIEYINHANMFTVQLSFM
ncbi:hypothetical protein [Sphingobacterium ginsenosidimutans]|uniref:hypothetical protein n=1 Tax=Sphingobacterium ginsenosidimutans TaxID=687845 RepID=UPI0031F87993